MSLASIAHFPLFLDLQQVPVLLVGAGAVGQRKLMLLRRCGADLTVVDPNIDPDLAQQLRADGHRVAECTFSATHLAGQRLVIAATDDPLLNADIAASARAAGIWVNAVDQPEAGDAIVPAIVSRGPITIGISSSGVAPVLARRLRARIESELDPSVGVLAELLREYRPQIRAAFGQADRRRAFYDHVLDGPLPDLLRTGQIGSARAWLDSALSASADSKAPSAGAGRVILLGAGPGDPGLLTLAGLRHLQRADVIVHDRLVSAEVLDLARRDAERIEVGKTGGGHSVSQLTINTLLVALAQSGRYVVRLKGGDPLTFARGGEELDALRAHDIRYEIVPGITAAQGCAAYAGIPLTHRDHAQAVRLVTAHCQGSIDKLDWQALKQGGETLVFYMALAQATEIQLRLLEGGWAPETPFAAVENGTRSNQRVVNGRLDQLVQTVHAQQLGSPALLLVGAVTDPQLRHAWFGAAAVSGLDPALPPNSHDTAVHRAAHLAQPVS